MISEHTNVAYDTIANRVAASIAPTWPLDQSIAVNPWWPQRHQAATKTFAEQAVITGETSLMDREYFQTLWKTQIFPVHLQQALNEYNSTITVKQLIEDLHASPDVSSTRWKTLAELLDSEVPSKQGHSWAQEIIQQVSQFIALYHQYPERFDATGADGEHLYQSWREVVTRDKGIKTLLGVDLLDDFGALPKTLSGLFTHFTPLWRDIWHDEAGTYAYMRATLQQLSGWAGWQAWLDWQAALENSQPRYSHALGLTAILLAWDHVLMQWLQKQHLESALKIRQTLRQQATNINASYHFTQEQLKPLWLWQRALEISVQRPWIEQIKTIAPQSIETKTQLQAVFCIDVRSEPMRRALEAQNEAIETLGFAGFFGIPIAYQTQDGSFKRPQLPGLLSPALVAQQTQMQPDRWLRLTKLGWQNSLEKPSSNLGMVEAGGLLKLGSLFKRVILQDGANNPIDQDLRSNEKWQLKRGDTLLSVKEKAELGAGILKAMGISHRLANVVLLTGHGSQTCNNHTSSSLDCGACGGQSGEVNVKVLAALLNDPQVRQAMTEFNVAVPDETHFYAALHNTTTDDITVFDAPEESWRNWLLNASKQARQSRLSLFDQSSLPSENEVKRFFKQRATNWAQMRPEWGLCNNAGVFIAPRSLTKNLDFSGRAFLHEYHADLDPQATQLEKIMTAPLLVMNWINLQYYASVTTPEKYGSGNKLLHNVVGGHIGVFEGNGGDLRIGLSQQSVHDGKQYRHQPVRLSAYIKAPKESIEYVMNKHQDVASLVNNQWLYLYHIDENNQVFLYQNNLWIKQ